MRKKLFNQGFVFMIVGIVAGAFYREFTKFIGFEGVTSMSLVHTHLIATGAIIAFLFSVILKAYDIKESKKLEQAWLLYFIGVIGNAAIMFIRGLLTVIDFDMTRMINMSLSGVAGIVHILLTIGIIWFMLQIKRQIQNQDA